MSTQLLINATPYEIRIALLEHGNLAEFYLEHPAEKGLVGNVYRGRVVRVLPGMQAAFVDVGLERTGFLYVDDVLVTSNEVEKRLARCDRGDGTGHDTCCGHDTDPLCRRHPGQNIEDLLSEGQDIMVQVCKEPLGSKGARLTCHITLPCRNLVFMPRTEHIGISRKIEDEDVRQMLRQDIEALRPAGAGFIVRTVAETATNEDLEADMEFLLHTWEEIQARATTAPVPGLIYQDLDITLRVVRDVFSPEVDQVVVDEPETYQRVLQFVETFVPHLKGRVELAPEDPPIFDAYGVELEVNRALERKIWLRCGGYIIIEPTEALTVIDVNTGRYVGKNGLEETIFKTNMEAAKEIAYQLRLRNIGGIIIVDFIDMEDEEHREAVFNALKEAAKKDKSRLNILRVSEFGLVQMTRKRNREDLEHLMCEPCNCCQGTGVIRSSRSLCYDVFRQIEREACRRQAETVVVRVHPRVAELLLREEAHTVDYLEKKCGKRIQIMPIKDFHPEKYEFTWQ
ncbi:Rne/Rng family ribonuclease [Desulfurivibrio alkaliphilus]|uniref:Ribonuclease G n=1 Tax=Desulfurivibrio alkaliphilus (strain DSM 19089 / UNIQEM U267 / AHT2) TaxID=589865 RepID=D6Z2T3_DESAT|nr:Rne/Rng family ribonuclease [Desulfurivibrio alkaliphilus]ADH85858.1 ribonuclease, Rne/Rng family [Desulfurivibrio alkaliphilus AHT 2]